MSTYPLGIWRPGPYEKQNGGVNACHGVTMHSMVGTFAGAMGELDKPARRASWHYSVLQSGKVYAHYTDETQTWHAGSARNNDLIGIEHEGGYAPEDEPLTDLQRAASVELVKWLSERHGFPLLRGVGLFEHHEVSGEPTACPSHRIPWDYYTVAATPEEEDMTPYLVLEDGTPNTWLIGYAAPVLLGSQAELAAMTRKYGPPMAEALSIGTIKQLRTA